MAASFGWGLVAASSLVLGARVALRYRIGLPMVGLVMAFGAGVLIGAVAFVSLGRRRSRRPGTAGRWSGCSPAAASSSPTTR